ncbi:ricin-type beta-trefoil lectin domain protein [Paraburkholderia sp. Tr-20389]|uniref:PIG-L family deacetylase n=1 Tax=Paraburkholderia sp. Tr-20389 TaxID=2703903 RepID=UPI00197CD9A7|nr:PIG-L family deacetylase [Paraburkholderia sp. Tr-20389]MBN3753317.1 ricin-type beta-trefoil lectin domain protein [Paraburkholderia sp. Tr-20389]
MSTSPLSRLSHFVLFLLCLCFISGATTSHASTVDCSAGTLVTVVAHLDDDLLFVEPEISERLRAGWCVTTVHLIGGANGANFAYVQKREEGSRLAYARAAGVANAWGESTIRIAGKPVFQLTLKAQPRVRLLELRLPGGAVRGGRVPLALLWDQGATLSTYPMGRGEIPAARYTRDSLSAVLKSILQDATRIATLNPDTVPFIEHPDHIYAARITRHIAQTLERSVPIGYYITYPTGNWPPTLFGDAAQRKRDVAASYFSVDGGDFAHVFGEYQWDGNWVLRNYVRNDTTLHKVPDFVALPSVLFNAGSNQCLTSRGAGREPVLAPCDDSRNQQWKWEPRATYAGNQHNAALVSASSGLCVSEQNGALTEEPCEEWSASQRWTPWDFGLIFTPSRRCLGEEDNRLHIRGCASLTTRYRWSAARPAWSTDLRLAGAMYGDVTGQGTPSAIYLQRRSDGPGFDVYVQNSVLRLSETPDNWYANAVSFDSRATQPTCNTDTLCFDSARFLIGDFDGDGRADLMVVTPRHGGSAFWLLKSNGNRFLAPTLWFQSNDDIPAERAQQYISFSTKESPSEKILIAVQRSDHTVELWTVGADHAGHIQQTKVLDSHRFRSGVQILSLRSEQKRSAPFIAIQSTDESPGMAVTTFGFDNGRWSTGKTSLLPSLFKRDMTRFTNDASADMSIVITVPHFAEPGGVDVWRWNVARPDMAPVFLKYLPDIRWQDAAPSVLHDASSTALFFYERTDAILTNTLFTAGKSTLVRYPFNENDIRSTPAESFLLPAVYSESLWLERVVQ